MREEITPVSSAELIGEAAKLKIQGYRLVTLSCTEIDASRIDVLYHFDKDLGLKHLRLTALKQITAGEATAHEHYAEHTDKPFFGELVDFITGGPLVAAVLEGVEAVRAARQLIGATNPIEAETGSIRGDFGTEVTFNLVHGSDSDESATREIGIWFPELG